MTAGKGYWMFFAADTMVTLNGAGVGTLRQSLLAGQFVMVGNPSGVQAVALSGADEVLTYDPVNGYTNVTQLAVGQGAWALSTDGGTLTMTATGAPLPIPTATPTPSPSPSTASSLPSPSSRTFNVPQDCRGSVTITPGTIHNVAQTLTVSVSSSFPNQPFALLIAATLEGGGSTDSQGSYSGTIPFTPITLAISGVPGATIVGSLPVVAAFSSGCAAGSVTIQP